MSIYTFKSHVHSIPMLALISVEFSLNFAVASLGSMKFDLQVPVLHDSTPSAQML